MSSVEVAPVVGAEDPDGLGGLELEAKTSAEAVLRNMHRILPGLAEEADETDRLARLSPRAERLMRAAGVFELGVAAFRGGVEGTLRQQLDAVATVSAVDAGTGWNVGVLNAGGYYATRIPEEGFQELYGDTLDHPTSGAFHPPGRAEIVDGGYLVSGDWGWGSGSYTADYMVGGCLVYQDGEPVIGATGKQALYGVYLPREAVVVADDWQVLGVSGSGSTSYAVPVPAFVPASHVFDREPLDDGSRDPLNKSVHVAFFGLTGVSLGIAKHLVELATEHLRERYASRPGGADPAMMQYLGEAAAEVEFAYAGAFRTADLIDEVLFTPGREITALEKARMVTTNQQAGIALRRVINLTSEVAQTAYIMDRNPMQRVLRDGMAALAHAGTRRGGLGMVGQARVASPDEVWQL